MIVFRKQNEVVIQKLKKRAIFAENSRSWSKKHEQGAKIHKPFGHRSILDNGFITTKRLKND